MTMTLRHVPAFFVLLIGTGCATSQAQAPATPPPNDTAFNQPQTPQEPPEESEQSHSDPPDSGQNPDDGCSDRMCSGRASAELRQVVAQRAAMTRRCYQDRLRDDPTISGKLVIGIRVTTSGGVCSAEVVKDDLGDELLAACVRNTMQGAPYPAAEGGCVDLAVPLSFATTQSGDAGGATNAP